MGKYLVVITLDGMKYVSNRTASHGGEALADAMDAIVEPGAQCENMTLSVTKIEEKSNA